MPVVWLVAVPLTAPHRGAKIKDVKLPKADRHTREGLRTVRRASLASQVIEDRLLHGLGTERPWPDTVRGRGGWWRLAIEGQLDLGELVTRLTAFVEKTLKCRVGKPQRTP